MKKVISLVLLLALAIMILPATVTAASQPEIGMESKAAKAGETVELKLLLRNNTGISGLVVSLDYDDTVLTLTEVKKGSLFSGFTSGKNYVWDESENVVVDGTLATFVFTVADNAAAGDYSIDVIVRNCVDIDLNDVSCTGASGVVRVACSHSLDEVSAHAATCDNDGNNALYICNLCNKVFKADGVTETTMEAEKIPALGHDMADATCTKPATCKREGCGYIDGEPLGHSYKAEWEKNENGHWHICNVCEEPGELTAHVPGAEATENSAQTCTVCGFEISPPLPHIHTTSKVEGFAATCTQAGQKTYYTCPCGEWFEDPAATVEIADHTGIVIAALGHDIAPATCTEAAACQREGCDYTEGEALGHNWVDETCQAPKHCDRCSQTDGEALPHTEGGWQLDSHEHWKICASCEAELEATRQAHTDADADGICEICNEAIPVTPATGDATNLWLFVCALVFSVMFAALLVFEKKRVNG